MKWSSQNKYRAQKTEYNGRVYDSRHEAERAAELQILERAGKISNLRYQVHYTLIPAQREPDTIGKRGGVKRGKVIEKECVYIADFAYTNESGEEIIEDAKGYRDGEAYKTFVIKRKLMLYVHGVKVREV